jgi:sigma-B regulation protein RsbU (phosphoserine phosphatase)
MRILVAEDERITRTSLLRQLQSWGHEVATAEDGQRAWELFEQEAFDLILTDWEMPNLSGVELIERVRNAPSATYTYVIMLTSRSDKSDLVRGIEAGADDFVAKPFDREELRVRLLAGVRIVNLERALHAQNEALRLASERIHHGLQAAARVQRAMLPKQNVLTPHVRTAWSYVPTDELAGDAIGLHLIEERYLVSYVLDVSGHGVPAALLSVTAMRALEPLPERTSMLRDMSATGPASVRPPSRVLDELNRRFTAGDNDGRFLTMILTVLDTHTGQLAFSRAGHPLPIILRGSEIIPFPDEGGFPIAITPSAEYEDASVRLEPFDRLLLCSDGILEQAASQSDEQFTSARLCAVLAQNAQLAPDALAASVIDALAEWAGGRNFADDVSFAVVEWLG